ncbi:hypothetical protein PMAYCL1PPCAC_02723, partial [Pristionchus mayeri]
QICVKWILLLILINIVTSSSTSQSKDEKRRLSFLDRFDRRRTDERDRSAERQSRERRQSGAEVMAGFAAAIGVNRVADERRRPPVVQEQIGDSDEVADDSGFPSIRLIASSEILDDLTCSTARSFPTTSDTTSSGDKESEELDELSSSEEILDSLRQAQHQVQARPALGQQSGQSRPASR